MKLYIYRNEDINGDDWGEPVDIIEGESDEDCFSQAAEKWDTNDYSWSFAEPQK